MLSKTPKAAKVAEDQAANLPLETPVDVAEAWERFSAAWPYDPVPYRRAAAQAAFAELTRKEREAAIRCARTFVKAWRAGGRGGAPDARNWIRERGWRLQRPYRLRNPARGSRPRACLTGLTGYTPTRRNFSAGRSTSGARSAGRGLAW